MAAAFNSVEINTWEFSMMSSREVTVYRIMEYLKFTSLSKNDQGAKATFKSLSRQLATSSTVALERV